jgi:hypothetical protein
MGVISIVAKASPSFLFPKREKTMVRKLIALIMLNTLCTATQAGEDASKANKVDALRQKSYSVGVITPIFSQLVMFSYPKGFVPAFEDTKGGNYIQESVLAGESVNKWTQMITITGAKNLALNPNATPTRFAESIAGGFFENKHEQCPQDNRGHRI